MAAVMQEVVEALSPLGNPDSSWNMDGEWFAKTFRDQMGIYRVYWRDDPQFDMTNTFCATPHLPCPKLDREQMSRLARFAIEANFGRTHRAKYKPEFDVHSYTCGRYAVTAIYARVIRRLLIWAPSRRPGRRPWDLLVREGRLGAVDDGVSMRSTAVFHVNSATFRSLARGDLTFRKRCRGSGADRRQWHGSSPPGGGSASHCYG